MSRRPSVVLLVVAIAAGLGLLASRQTGFWPTSAPPAPSKPPALQALTLLPQPRAIPDFSLQQSDGTALDRADLAGHWTLVFLGFTHCPDICPTTLAQLAQAQKAWESIPTATRPRLLFVSVDPQRDTPQRAGAYASGFHPETLAATGNVAALQAFAGSLSLVFMDVPATTGEHAQHGAQPPSVDHSAALAVLDPQSRMAGVITAPLRPQAIADDLRALALRAP